LLPRDSDPAILGIFVEHRAEHGDHQRGCANFKSDHRRYLVPASTARQRYRLTDDGQAIAQQCGRRPRDRRADGFQQACSLLLSDETTATRFVGRDFTEREQ
jgi:hypothetical protein